MDNQINKVLSRTIFCVVLSDLMGFWDASKSADFPQEGQNYKSALFDWLTSFDQIPMMDEFCPDHMAITKT